jgi:DNA (cytosine-5)-methyltransferase 1
MKHQHYYIEDHEDGTLRANGGGGSRTDRHPLINGAGVRRLTPREYERLQGLPDDWTLIEWQGKPAADSRRYAAVGDAVTVNVAEWIGARLAEAVAA